MANQVRDTRTYTYADLKKIDTEEGQHLELVNGTLYLLARPSIRHQTILLNIASYFKQYLKGKRCAVFLETEVNLFGDKEDGDIKTLVVPDIYVTCTSGKNDGQKFNGAPELIIEILSTNYQKDRWRNFNLYLQAGVKEYWIVDQYRDSVDVFVLKNGEYVTHGYYQLGVDEEDVNTTIKSTIFEDLDMDVSDIFE